MNIPEVDLTKILSTANELQTLLQPHLKVLTTLERQELPKMGDKTVAFVQKTLDYAQQNPELVPPYLDLPALLTDVAAVQVLGRIARILVPLAESVSDSMTLSGSEAYQGSLVFYNAVKGAAKVKAPKAGSIYDDLSNRFPGRPSAKKATM